MTRLPKDCIPLSVDIDGIEIPAHLRPPKDGRANYHVRWLLHGTWRSRSTGRIVESEAKVVGRQIVRGEPIEPLPTLSEGMTIKEFEQVQKEHFQLGSRAEAASKSQKSFDGIWRSLRSVVMFRTIQEFTATHALQYVGTLKRTSKARNHKHRKKVAEPMSPDTIRKHVRTLAAAWNRVRRDHPECFGGIRQQRLVTANPWEQIRKQVPLPRPKGDPVQFDLDSGELNRFLDCFADRPIAELFLVTSFWAAGRIEEMAHLRWSWINGDYIFVPEWITKGGRAKVVRIPKTVRTRLERIRVPGEDFVFIRFPQEVKDVSGRDTLAYTPDRLIGRMVRLVKDAAVAIGKPHGLSHHALRRTVMELSDEGELMDKEKESARKLQTTPLNKRINYTKRGGKKRVILANGLFENITVALQDYPSLVARLGCDIISAGTGDNLRAMKEGLTPLEKQQLRKLLDEDDSEGAGAVVA
jgi:integrase